jgi:hypothetical protein
MLECCTVVIYNPVSKPDNPHAYLRLKRPVLEALGLLENLPKGKCKKIICIDVRDGLCIMKKVSGLVHDDIEVNEK